MADGPTSGTPRTEADLLTNFFQAGQANNAITSQDMRDLIASVRYLQPIGWQFRFDSQFTSGSPLTLVDGVPQGVTFTDNPGEDLRYPSTFPEIWAGDTPVLPQTLPQRLSIPTFANGFGIVRFSLTGQYTGGTVPHLDFQIDTGSDPVSLGGADSNIIYQDSAVFAKGSGAPQWFNFVVPLFGGADFVTNGAKFILTASSNNIDVWSFALTAGAILVPNPAGEG